ncbi:MAG: hypothetical protein PVF17_12030 [Ignavibacteria bacterium]|jgi:hypothetical protein
MRADGENYSYHSFFQKLCEGNYRQSELNNFIERLFKIGKSYAHHRYNRVKNIINTNNGAMDEIAIEAIAPLFQNANYNNHYVIVDEIKNWDPPINSENESLFFLNKIISKRMEQHICRMLRESDPFFSKILDSINYLIRSANYKKVNYLGKVYIVESNNSVINWIVIPDEEFNRIPAYLFYDRKTLLKSLFYFLKNETQYFEAIPLNELVYRLKKINLFDYIKPDSVNEVSAKLEIKDIVNSALKTTLKKLKNTYYEKGKLSEGEYESFKLAIESLAADLCEGGTNSSLYNYLVPHMDGLTKDQYQIKYHNILEYLLKQLKEKIAEIISVK